MENEFGRTHGFAPTGYVLPIQDIAIRHVTQQKRPPVSQYIRHRFAPKSYVSPENIGSVNAGLFLCINYLLLEYNKCNIIANDNRYYLGGIVNDRAYK